MKLELIYFDDKMLVSKEIRAWEIWQEKLYYYKSSLSFNNQLDLFEYLKRDYKLTEKDIKIVEESLLDTLSNYFLINFVNHLDGKVEVMKSSLDFLGNKGELVYWEDWSWVLTKQNEDFYLWVYIGGIADIVREIKLSVNQKSDFVLLGKPFIEKLAKELQTFNSPVYSKAIDENRKIL